MTTLSKLTQFTVDAEGRLTSAAMDPVPVVKTDGSQAFTADQAMGGHKITGAADPTGAQDVATKAYVDGHSITPTSPGGALVLLEQHTAAASTSLDFTTCISSLYDEYVIELINIVPATNAAAFLLQMSTNGGSTYDVTAGHYSWASLAMAFNATGSNGSVSATAITLINDVANAAKLSQGGRFTLVNPLSTSLYKLVFGLINQTDSTRTTAALATVMSGKYLVDTSAVNALRFIMSAGNITSGTIRVYGVAKASGTGGLALASATAVYRSTAQTLTHVTEAAISFDTSNFDVDGMWAISPNPTRLTARQTGKFYVNGQVQLGSGFMGAIHTRIYQNGTLVAERTEAGLDLASGTESHGVGCLLALTVGDSIELRVQLDLQAGSGTFNVNGGVNATFFSAFTSGGGGGTGDMRADGSIPFAADESMGGHKITNLATPTVSTDAANKSYVDGLLAPAPVVTRVYQTAVQSVPVTADTALILDTVDTDAAGFWSAGAPTRMTVPSGDGGSYSVFGQIKWSLTGTGGCFLRLKKNGTTLLAESYVPLLDVNAVAQISSLVELIAGDYLELYIFQNASGAQSTVGGTADTYLALTKAGGGGGSSFPLTIAKGDLLASTGSEFDVQGVGSNKKVLTADSSQARGVAWSYAGRTLLEQHATTGAVTHVDFVTAITSDFDEYEIDLVGVLISSTVNADQLQIVFSSDGGVTWNAFTYNYSWVTIPGLTATTGSVASFIGLGAATNINSGGGSWSGRLLLTLPPSLNPTIAGNIGCRNGGNAASQNIGSGVALTTTAINAVRVQVSADNFTGGNIRMYGVSK